MSYHSRGSPTPSWNIPKTMSCWGFFSFCCLQLFLALFSFPGSLVISTEGCGFLYPSHVGSFSCRLRVTVFLVISHNVTRVDTPALLQHHFQGALNIYRIWYIASSFVHRRYINCSVLPSESLIRANMKSACIVKCTCEPPPHACLIQSWSKKEKKINKSHVHVK